MAPRPAPALPFRRDSGQILVLTAVVMVVLLGIAALSLDVSLMYDKRNRLQAAADAAAKSAAIEQLRQGSSVSITSLERFADEQVAAHGFTPTRLGVGGTTTVIISVGSEPAPPPFDELVPYVEAEVSEVTSMFFGRILGMTSMTPRATARAGPSRGAPCLVTFEDFAMLESVFNMPGCAIAVGGDISLDGTTTITPLSIGVTGDCCGSGTAAPVEPLQTGAPPPSDPYPTPALPPPAAPAHTCVSAFSVSVATTLSTTDVDSYYCGLQFNGGSLTLNPGVYHIAGPITASGATPVNITGSNVMIYLAPGGSINLNSTAVVMNLTGRISADAYRGVLFYQDRSNSSSAVFAQGDGTLTLSGALYFPGAALHVRNSLPNGFGSDCFVAVAQSLELKANGTIINTCSLFGAGMLRTVAVNR